ncbi:MAG TPA: OBAP family protein [Burkholderiales bacterium]|nr:OBAP family protein [Burkholderiales bacterium]
MKYAISTILLLAATLTACTGRIESNVKPPGASESAKTNVLEAGAAAVQTKAPLNPMDVYLVGFHGMKHDPSHQMEAHHYCAQVNEDFAQCVIFDGNTRNANLTGIEYIISEQLFESLPEKEKQYWHPHNYEILSGQLVAPGLPSIAEKALFKGKMNSYGKTWHVWNAGNFTRPGDKLPIGDPLLAWSFNRDGEVAPGLVEERDRRMNINTAEKRRERTDLVPLAKPQSGVDDLKGKFAGPTTPMPGVESKK